MLLTVGFTNAQKSKIIFNIPPPSGYGSGVCEVTLTIDEKYILATETCGGNNGDEHTESSEKLFKVNLMKNYKYKISKLYNTSNGNSFGSEYFEIKENKLYLYDENLKIINEWFCTLGKIPASMKNKETCDCIFLPSKS